MIKSFVIIGLFCLRASAQASQNNDDPSRFQRFTTYIYKAITCSSCRGEVEPKFDKQGNRVYSEHEVDLMIKFVTQLPLGDEPTEYDGVNYILWPQ